MDNNNLYYSDYYFDDIDVVIRQNIIKACNNLIMMIQVDIKLYTSFLPYYIISDFC